MIFRALSIPAFFIPLLLSGCGVESVSTAADVAKLQAQHARQSKETLDSVKVSLEAATQNTANMLQRSDGESPQ